MTIRYVQRELPPPEPQAAPDETFVAANQAHKRSMTIQRLLDNGVSYADAVAFHDLADRNVAWAEAGEWLGQRNLMRANESMAGGFTKTARAHFLHACACFRFAQSAHTFDTEEKRRLYSKVIDSFAEAAPLLDAVAEKLELPCRDGTLCGWLLRPEDVSSPPVVVIFGGADGWRESYYTTGLPLLAEGIAICLLDGPGQGESRIFRNLYLTPSFADDFAVAVRHLQAHPHLGGSVSVFGNSLGGTLSATIAATVEGIDACCVNGGSIAPAEMADRFPRVLDRVAAMMGSDDRDQAHALLRGMDLRDTVKSIDCPLLVLHGGEDPLFAIASAQAIEAGAGSTDKTMLVWDDGDHCIYNHAFERNALAAEWFATRLTTRKG